MSVLIKEACEDLRNHGCPACFNLLKGIINDFKSSEFYPKKDPPGSEHYTDGELNKFLTEYFTNAKSPHFKNFENFCISRHCDENLHWLAHFQKMEKNVKKPKKFLLLFQEAWRLYFDPASPTQVNLGAADMRALDDLYAVFFNTRSRSGGVVKS